MTPGNYGHLETFVAGARVYARTDDSTGLELAYLTNAAREVDALTRAAVKAARLDGLSWSEVGARLGISKQAAQQKYGRP